MYFSRNWPRLLYSKGRSTGGRWEHGAWPRNLPRRLPFFPSNQTTNPGYSPFFPLFHHSRLCGGAECIYLCQTSSSSSTTKNVFKKLHHQNLRGSQTLVLEWEAGAAHQGERDDGWKNRSRHSIAAIFCCRTSRCSSAAMDVVLILAGVDAALLACSIFTWIFFLLCFFHRCCSTTGEFLNGQYVSVLVANIVIH